MLDPLAPLRVVATTDPALDTDSMGDALVEYARSRDPELLKFKLGATPTWYVVRGMTASYLLDVVYPARGRTQQALAFLAAVHEIDLPDGRKLTPSKTDQGAYRQRVATEEWLDQVVRAVGVSALLEVGTVAIRRAELPEDARGPFV